jgi:hypothetical protein
VVSSEFNRCPKIDLGTQPWSVISLFEGSNGRGQAYAGGDHGGSREAAAAGARAQEQGLARVNLSYAEPSGRPRI